MIRPDPLPLALALAAALACVSPASVAAGNPPRAAETGATGIDHAGDACTVDADCVSITTVSPSCRHVDPKAAQVCPGVNRRRAAEYGRVDCAVNNPCRAAAGYRCSQGRCKTRE